MPEGPEVETEKLHEAIQEELEHDGGAFLRRIALTTALLAAIAAVAALHAGSTVNEALVLKAEANILQTRASDQWAYYQAKGVKAAVQEASRSSWLAAGKDAPPAFEQTKGRYAAEQAEIKAKAEELERERDEKSHEADHLLHRHHRFASSVALFQVSIALGALAALTRNKLLWLGSLLLGGGGLAVAALALFG
jgi:Domain of unknown function (DUF4337)